MSHDLASKLRNDLLSGNLLSEQRNLLRFNDERDFFVVKILEFVDFFLSLLRVDRFFNDAVAHFWPKFDRVGELKFIE